MLRFMTNYASACYDDQVEEITGIMENCVDAKAFQSDCAIADNWGK